MPPPPGKPFTLCTRWRGWVGGCCTRTSFLPLPWTRFWSGSAGSAPEALSNSSPNAAVDLGPGANERSGGHLRRRFPDIEDVKELEAMTTPDPIQWQDWAVAMDPCPLEVFKE